LLFRIPDNGKIKKTGDSECVTSFPRKEKGEEKRKKLSTYFNIRFVILSQESPRRGPQTLHCPWKLM
jgi:hypothetical protein